MTTEKMQEGCKPLSAHDATEGDKETARLIQRLSENQRAFVSGAIAAFMQQEAAKESA